MLDELKQNNKLIGLKQSTRALENDEIAKAFIARDCAPEIFNGLVLLCENKNVPVEYVESMAELGEICQIDVKAAVATILKSK